MLRLLGIFQGGCLSRDGPAVQPYVHFPDPIEPILVAMFILLCHGYGV